MEDGRDIAARRFVEASRRAEIIALVASAETDHDVAHATIDELCEALEAELAFVLVAGPRDDGRRVVGRIGLSDAHADALGQDPLCRAALTGARAEVHEGTGLLGAGARQAVLSPWRGARGRHVLIGVARLHDAPFDPAEVALVEAVTASAGHALERTWLSEERDRHAGRQAALARAAKSLSATLDVGEVLAALSREVPGALEADAVAVYAVEEDGGLAPVAGTARPAAPGGAESLVARVARTGAPQVRQPLAGHATAPWPGAREVRSGLAVPIRTDRVVGVVAAGHHAPRRVETEDVDLLVAFAELAALAWRNAADHAAVRRAATLDSLTGALNHGAFQDRLREELARAARTPGSLALVLLDLNDFKGVNDTFGHLAGDAFLRGVAEGLRDSVRSYDQVARYGGDEFALLLPATDEETARRVADRALAAVAAVPLPGDTASSATAGLSHWRPGDDANALIARADHALLLAKAARRPETGRQRSVPAVLTARRERRQLRRLVTAGSLGTRLSRLMDERAIAETAIVELGSALGYERCLLVRGARDRTLAVIAAGGEERSSTEPRPAVTQALRRCIQDRRTVLIHDVRDDEDRQHAELAVPVYVGGSLWGALGVESRPDATFDEHDAELVRSVADHLGTALRTAELYDQLDQTHLGTAAALAAALEAKDSYTADHARSLADLAVAVGRELGLSDVALHDLRYGAIFHDIGKIAIPDAILNKPGPLTAEEQEVVRRHPEAGEEILRPVPFLAGVREIVRHDHERWDGNGYPDRLRAEEIPVGARIVLVVDAYHAMRSDRPYRAGMTQGAARAELLQHAGTQFDPRVVEGLLAVLARTPELEPV